MDIGINTQDTDFQVEHNKKLEVLTLLDQKASSKALVLVPEIHRRSAALKVHLAVRIEQFVELNLHVAELLRRQEAIVDSGVVCVGPG